MTHKQKQAFLQARAASSIQAITAALADDVSAITNGTQLQNASQQGSQMYLPPASVAVEVPPVQISHLANKLHMGADLDNIRPWLK